MKTFNTHEAALPVAVLNSCTADFPPNTASKSTLIAEEAVFWDAE